MFSLQHKITALLGFALLSACGEFDPGSLIEDTRVLGARVEVEGDASRASPLPEERVSITWLTVNPAGAPTLSWAFVGCVDGEAGIESCAERPVAFEQGEGSVPQLSLTVPSRKLLGNSENLRILGVICDGGRPSLDARGRASCEGASRKSTSVQLDVSVAREGALNLNPDLSTTTVSLDAETWQPIGAELDPDECTEELPRIVANGKKHALHIRLGSEARETFEDEGGERRRETLQVSHFVTAGEIESQFSFIEADDRDPMPELTLDWHAPEEDEVGPDGKVVQLLVVVRDLRGGFTAVQRALCAVPKG